MQPNVTHTDICTDVHENKKDNMEMQRNIAIPVAHMESEHN